MTIVTLHHIASPARSRHFLLSAKTSLAGPTFKQPITNLTTFYAIPPIGSYRPGIFWRHKFFTKLFQVWNLLTHYFVYLKSVVCIYSIMWPHFFFFCHRRGCVLWVPLWLNRCQFMWAATLWHHFVLLPVLLPVTLLLSLIPHLSYSPSFSVSVMVWIVAMMALPRGAYERFPYTVHPVSIAICRAFGDVLPESLSIVSLWQGMKVWNNELNIGQRALLAGVIKFIAVGRGLGMYKWQKY